MKILWISQSVPYPPKTGVLQRNYNLIREVSRYADIYLVAILQEDVLPGSYDIKSAKNELGKLCRDLKIVKLKTESSTVLFFYTALKSLFTEKPLSVNWTSSRTLRETIQKSIQENDFDIVHFDTISVADYRKEITGSSTILNHHNIESHLLERRTQYENNLLKRFYYSLEAKKLEKYEKKVCDKFDVNFTVSKLDGERLLNIAPNARYEVIANGVDTEYFDADRIEVIPKSVIMVSGMNWFPNRDAVLYMCDKIWPLLKSTVPEATWTIVGASPPKKIRELARNDNNVVVTDFVDDVRPYMKKAETYLCPMRDGGGTRLKILDALSMGMPIVATTMACEGIDVEPERHVLIANSPEEFIKQIVRVQNDESLRSKLSSEARKFVEEKFSWSVIGKKLSDIYTTLESTKREKRNGLDKK